MPASRPDSVDSSIKPGRWQCEGLCGQALFYRQGEDRTLSSGCSASQLGAPLDAGRKTYRLGRGHGRLQWQKGGQPTPLAALDRYAGGPTRLRRAHASPLGKRDGLTRSPPSAHATMRCKAMEQIVPHCCWTDGCWEDLSLRWTDLRTGPRDNAC